MKSVEFLTEAEQNVAKKKIDQQLDQLSNQEIDALLSMIDKSLDEGRFDYNPLAGPASDQSKPQTPKPQQFKQQSQQQKKQPQSHQKKSEVRTYVDDLDNKQKETLKAVLQKEKEQRQQTGEKVSAAPKSAGKLVKLMAGILLTAGLVGGAVTYGPQAVDTAFNAVVSMFQAESGLLTGKDYIKMMKVVDPNTNTKDPNLLLIADAIDQDNGKFYKIEKPKNEKEAAQLYYRMTVGSITTVVNDMFSGNYKVPDWFSMEELSKDPIKMGLRVSLYKQFPVDNQSVKNISTKDISEFSIKGIHFGMTPEQVAEARKNTFLTIGGTSGWKEIYHNNKLVGLKYRDMNDPNATETWLEKLSKKYGEPTKLMRSTSTGLANKPYRWTIQDAQIDLVGGNVYIYDPVLNKQRNLDIENKNQAEKNKQAKDF